MYGWIIGLIGQFKKFTGNHLGNKTVFKDMAGYCENAFQGDGVYYGPGVDDAIGGSSPDSYDVHPMPHNMSNVHVYVPKNAGHYSWFNNPNVIQQDLVAALQSISKQSNQVFLLLISKCISTLSCQMLSQTVKICAQLIAKGRQWIRRRTRSTK